MSNKKDAIGDRMKEYENASRYYLTRRIPVIIRVDGRAFHTFTKGMNKPFDSILMGAMQDTMKYLCEHIQGCVFGYTQSDEITLVLTDYATITTDAWFGNNVQKMASISASMATLAFNRIFAEMVQAEERVAYIDESEDADKIREYGRYLAALSKKLNTATFDSRVFSIPKDEVCNCLIWRQQDATRNSIEAVGQANFSHRLLQGKNCNDIQDMLWQEKGINWSKLPTACKRGAACYRVEQELTVPSYMNPDDTIRVTRRGWRIDTEIPVFTQDRDFIERWL